MSPGMNWPNQPVQESQVGHPSGSGQRPTYSPASREVSAVVTPPVIEGSTNAPGSLAPHSITIGKSSVVIEGSGKSTELFTVTLGKETIELQPFKNWGQLDACKWMVQGKLP